MYTNKGKYDRKDYNPNVPADPSGIKMEKFPRITVELVDTLIEVAKKNGSKDYVQTSFDWDTIAKIYKLFQLYFPKTEKDFIKQIADFRKDENAHGIGKEGSAMIQHQLEVPRPLFDMIMAIFPLQKWDKKFVKDIASVLPQLKPISDNY